jgi:pSer/pThr/pTyr-binding forkhead associated (FHA) protein
MNPLEFWLNKLETRLQSLVEGTADRLLPSRNLAREERLAGESPEHTAPLEIELAAIIPVQPLPPAAFLVVDGVRMFPLEQPVISIGRDPENDLVIPDPRVSRQHAQLRAVNGRFVVFDLDSTGGISLNGLPILHHSLSSGDVISLAGVPLVYGQESPSGAEHTQELVI